MREGSQEATTSGTAQRHWHARVIFGSFFQHNLQSSRMKTANSLDNLLQWFITLTVAKPFLLCNLDLACCSLNNTIVPLIPGRGGEQLFPSPYENLFLWGSNFLPSSLSTNQLQFFSETFQPIQINMVFQWMWLHTTGKKTVFLFSGFDFDCESHVLSLSLKHLLLSPCMGHYFWNHPWWLYPLLQFKTCIIQNFKGRDFCCSWSFYIFVLPCDSEILQLLSHLTLCWPFFCRNLEHETIGNLLNAISMYTVLYLINFQIQICKACHLASCTNVYMFKTDIIRAHCIMQYKNFKRQIFVWFSVPFHYSVYFCQIIKFLL